MAVISATNVSGLPLDKGIYQARILSNAPARERDQPSKWDKGLPREEIKLRVKGYANSEGGPLEVTDYITLYPKMGKRTKGYSLFSAALFGGKDIPEGENLDTDDLPGKDVMFVVDAKPNDPGMMIASYMPVPKAGTQTAGGAVRRVEPTEEDVDAI